MKKLVTMSILLALAVGLAGCHKKRVRDADSASSEVPAADASANTNADSGAQSGGATPFGADGAADPAAVAALSGKIVYFDYDKSEIKAEYAGVVSEAARNLVSHANWKVRLEGNTDARGTPEYNIGLGERRAQTVRRALMLQGVADGQIAVVSYGEERPAAEGEDETAFAKNRRVEMAAIP